MSFSKYVAKIVSAESLDAIARATGFTQRKSIINPESFLDAVFFSNSQSCPTSLFE